MNIDYQEHLPADFNNDSRVWIYQCNRLFTIHEALQIEDILKNFCSQLALAWYAGNWICEPFLRAVHCAYSRRNKVRRQWLQYRQLCTDDQRHRTNV